MRERGSLDQDIVAQDVLWAILGVVLACLVFLVAHIREAEAERKRAGEVASPGSVVVELVWPNDSVADVDMWVQAPGDVPVGYSNKGGEVFNLLRDDLGAKTDMTGLNYENSYSRGVPAGEYVVNLHLYNSKGAKLPIPCKVVVSVKDPADPNSSARQILVTEVTLKRDGEERTAFRFRLTGKGALVPGSVHAAPKMLRSEG